MVSAHRGWGTQRANTGACSATSLSVHAQGNLHPVGHHWAPDAFRAATSARRGSGTLGAKPGAPAAQRRCSPAPRGSRTQWATAGARAEQGTWGSHTRKHREAGSGRPEDGGGWTAKTVKRPPQQPTQPQYANYWALLRRKQHQQEHRPQRPTERSNLTQHAEGRTVDCPGPRKETTTRRNVTQGADPGVPAWQGLQVAHRCRAAAYLSVSHPQVVFVLHSL